MTAVSRCPPTSSWTTGSMITRTQSRVTTMTRSFTLSIVRASLASPQRWPGSSPRRLLTARPCTWSSATAPGCPTSSRWSSLSSTRGAPMWRTTWSLTLRMSSVTRPYFLSAVFLMREDLKRPKKLPSACWSEAQIRRPETRPGCQCWPRVSATKTLP